ncbi:GldG family protein [Solimonas variicoloris]|uniref:GldG family protein n=1 Tax=Solimonas variicoloris TaxID=254408 RepID=UPI00036F7628|nr:GldG family protein [Solimonas variicoloris]
MKQKKQILAQQLFNGLLILAVIVLLGFLSVRFKADIDWTAGKRNTLTAASVKQLESMPDPIVFHVFAPSGADTRHAIEADLERYTRVKKNIELDFIDPSASPQKVREFNVNYVGQIVAEYQGRRETLNATTEPAITTALQRLAYGGEQWVVFLEGHGERSTAEPGPTSFSRFAQALKDKGLKVQGLNLVKTPKIPDNTSVLVIASPASKLLEGEAQIVADYVAHGGNVLWLADPDYAPGLEPLAKELGISWQNGYAIFPDYQILGTGHPGFFAAIDYPPNPVTQGLDMVTLFPLVRSLTTAPAGAWKAQPLLQTADSAWLETGDINAGAVQFDDQDIKGPLTIGATLTRDYQPAAAAATPDAKQDAAPEMQAHPQRVALIGDADFLSDAYLDQLGNQQLGLNLVQWLASRDAQLNIDVPKAPDRALYLPGWATLAIAGGFVVLLPLLLLGYGVLRWAVRRRR